MGRQGKRLAVCCSHRSDPVGRHADQSVLDWWTSQNQHALLGLVAHFLDHSAGVPGTILLSLPR